jgi:peptide/nickel transport system permease protein
LVRRLVLAVGVLAAVSYGSFALMATRFSSTCLSAYTPTRQFPPLAASPWQAGSLWWSWLKGIPSGSSLGRVCGSETGNQVWPAFVHTAVLLTVTGCLVVVGSLLVGTLAASRSGSWLDLLARCFSYLGWAIPAFVLALVAQSVLRWAHDRFGFAWFRLSGWPGSCISPSGSLYGCGGSGSSASHLLEIVRSVTVPALVLAVAFIGLHSRYLRSQLLTAFRSAYVTTARAKGLPERTVVLRHALRNSLAVFASALLLDFGALFGAAMAVDWIFHLNGLGTVLITELAGIGGGEGPRFINPYAIETLLTTAAVVVVVSSVASELVVVWLDPRTRLQ